MKKMHRSEKQAANIIRRVLRSAAYSPVFFDLSAAEQIGFWIMQGYRRGKRDASRPAKAGVSAKERT